MRAHIRLSFRCKVWSDEGLGFRASVSLGKYEKAPSSKHEVI